MNSRSITATKPEDVQSALCESMTDGFLPTLAIVFMSVKQDRVTVCKVLGDAGISIFGATTHGEFISEELTNGAIAILLLDMDTASFTIFFEVFSGKNFRETAKSIAKRAADKFAAPAFLVSGSAITTDAEALLLGFEDILGREVNVFGGMAGDDYTFTDQFVFTNGKFSNEGIVALVVDETKITVKGRAFCGWKAAGTTKTVTKSEGNHVFTIDDVPVLELTKKFSGLAVNTTDTAEAVIQIVTSLPLQLQREKGPPIMRPGILVNFNDGSFLCSGNVPQGSLIRFSLPPDFDVVETVINGLKELRATEMPEADAVVVFSCAGRILSFGPMMAVEIEGVNNIWNVPMVGMFSMAELGRAAEGNLEMHNLTTCCIALKEK